MRGCLSAHDVVESGRLQGDFSEHPHQARGSAVLEPQVDLDFFRIDVSPAVLFPELEAEIVIPHLDILSRGQLQVNPAVDHRPGGEGSIGACDRVVHGVVFGQKAQVDVDLPFNRVN